MKSDRRLNEVKKHVTYIIVIALVMSSVLMSGAAFAATKVVHLYQDEYDTYSTQLASNGAYATGYNSILSANNVRVTLQNSSGSGWTNVAYEIMSPNESESISMHYNQIHFGELGLIMKDYSGQQEV
jgi:hypothetical protein